VADFFHGFLLTRLRSEALIDKHLAGIDLIDDSPRASERAEFWLQSSQPHVRTLSKQHNSQHGLLLRFSFIGQAAVIATGTRTFPATQARPEPHGMSGRSSNLPRLRPKIGVVESFYFYGRSQNSAETNSGGGR
jgi:hypothetical protein